MGPTYIVHFFKPQLRPTNQKKKTPRLSKGCVWDLIFDTIIIWISCVRTRHDLSMRIGNIIPTPTKTVQDFLQCVVRKKSIPTFIPWKRFWNESVSSNGPFPFLCFLFFFLLSYLLLIHWLFENKHINHTCLNILFSTRNPWIFLPVFLGLRQNFTSNSERAPCSFNKLAKNFQFYIKIKKNKKQKKNKFLYWIRIRLVLIRLS